MRKWRVVKKSVVTKKNSNIDNSNQKKVIYKSQKIEHSLQEFEQENIFLVFQKFSEDEIESFLMGRKVNKPISKKKKCRNCGFKTKCHLFPGNCSAIERNCRECKKKGHFPKSLKCKKFRSQNLHKAVSTCESLRSFLKSNFCKLSNKVLVRELIYYKMSNVKNAKTSLDKKGRINKNL